MALTTLQNSQRIIVFMEFFTLLMVLVFLTIRLIKKKIDSSSPAEEEGESVGPKYKESESQQQIAGQFEQPAIAANTFTEYDTCT
jgi:hypothetical protein